MLYYLKKDILLKKLPPLFQMLNRLTSCNLSYELLSAVAHKQERPSWFNVYSKIISSVISDRSSNWTLEFDVTISLSALTLFVLIISRPWPRKFLAISRK